MSHSLVEDLVHVALFYILPITISNLHGIVALRLLSQLKKLIQGAHGLGHAGRGLALLDQAGREQCWVFCCRSWWISRWHSCLFDQGMCLDQ